MLMGQLKSKIPRKIKILLKVMQLLKGKIQQIAMLNLPMQLVLKDQMQLEQILLKQETQTQLSKQNQEIHLKRIAILKHKPKEIHILKEENYSKPKSYL